MSAADRLQGYYPFDQEVIDTVAEVAERQASMTHNEFFTSVGIGDDVKKIAREGYVDIRPADHDPRSAMMIHLAMANPLDPNNLYQIATIAATNPNTRILAVGNPGGFGYPYGTLSREVRKTVAGGEFSPISRPLMDFAEKARIESVTQVGYSKGATQALAANRYMAFEVPHTVVIEPTNVVARNRLTLAQAFGSTNKALGDYVNANELPAFKAARKESIGAVNYMAGLLRLSNLAIAKGLARNDFEAQAADALSDNRRMKLTVAWGDQSELAEHEAISAQVERLAETFQPRRVGSIVLAGQKHALANDLALQAAIVRQGLTR